MRTNLRRCLALLSVTFPLLICASSRGDIINWTNRAGGLWSLAANWNPNRVPGATDDAAITAAGTYVVVLDINATVNSLSLGGDGGQPTLTDNSNSTLTLNSFGIVDTNGLLAINGGGIGGPGLLTVNGVFNWSGGQLKSGSTLAIGGTGVLNIGGNIQISGILTNAGAANWQAGSIALYYYPPNGYTGQVWNVANALWDVQCDQTLANAYYGQASFNNAGMFRKSAGTNTTAITVAFNNPGVVDVESGMVRFDGGGAGGGEFHVAANTAISFGNNNSGGAFTGAGSFKVTGGTLSLAGIVQDLALSGGAINGVNAAINNLTWSGGTLQGNTTVAGVANWTGGSLGAGAALTLLHSGVLNIGGNIQISGMLTNAGTVNWQAGSVALYYYPPNGYTGQVWNAAGSMWDAQSDQTLANAYYGLASFNNAGTFRKSGGTNTTEITVAFNNSSVVDVESGTVRFDGGGSGDGQFQAGADTVMSFGNDNSGGAFTGAGTFKVTGGTLGLAGTMQNLVLAGGAINGVNAGISNLTWSGGSLVGNNTVAGVANWTGGSLGPGAALTLLSSGVLNIGGNIQISGILTNTGTVNWQAGSVAIYYYPPNGYTGQVWNVSGALWNVLSDQTLANAYYGQASFNNAGIFRKSGGTNTTLITVAFNNPGLVDVATGMVRFDGGGSGSGEFHTAANSAISFGSDNSGGAFAGAGNFNVTGGTLLIAGAVQNLFLSGGAINGVNAGINNLTCSGGTLQGNTTIAGVGNWTGGSLAAGASLTVQSNSVMNIGGDIQISGILTNSGTVNWQAGSVAVNYYPPNGFTGQLWNLTNALWNVQCDQTLANAYYGQASFNNAGTFRKSGGTNTTLITVAFNNPGVVDVESGTVRFVGGGSGGGSFQAAPNTTISFGHDNSGGAFTGAGNFNVTGGTLGLAGTVQNLTLSGGAINGVNVEINNLTCSGGTLLGNSTVAAVANWTAGSLGAGAALTVLSNGVLNIGGSIQISGMLTNGGTVNWQAGNIAVNYYPPNGNTGQVWNTLNALWDCQCDQTLANNYYGQASFNNTGTFRKSGGTNSTTVTLAFNNSGVVDVQSGVVNLPGPYNLAGGSLNFGLNSRTNYGHVSLGGNPASLGGTVSANFNNGYSPAVNDSFAVLTYVSLAGAFTNEALPVFVQWGTNYTPTSFLLTVLDIVPLVHWSNPPAISYGTALGAAQLDAQPLVPGTFAYTPPAGTLLDAGTYAISAVFTPDNPTLYNSLTSRVSLVVSPAPLSVAGDNFTRPYGQANPAFTGSLTGLVRGDLITATFGCSATPTSVPGVYPVLPTLLDPNNRLPNYAITTDPGILTITPGPQPTVTNLSVTLGPTTGGTSVMLTGTGFENGATVAFGGVAAASVVFNSPNSLTVRTPVSAVGTVAVVLTNPDGNTVILPAAFTFGLAPVILAPPASVTNSPGTVASFSVNATGSLPLSYQWRFNQVTPLAGQTNATLFLVGVTPDAAGAYTVVVTNPFGSVSSSIATLTIGSPPCTPPPSGLVAWWQAENSALDPTGGNNGTLVGPASYAPGEVGQAFSLGGGYISINSGTANLPLGTNPRTIEAWVKTTMTGLGEIVSYGATSGGNAFTFGIYGAAVFVSAWSSPQYSVAANVNDGNFHHLAIAYDGTDAMVYCDGRLIDQRGFNIHTGSGSANIGARISPTEFFIGALDEVSIYNHALTAAEIAAIYAAGSTGKCVIGAPTELVVQPAAQSVPLGTSVSFSATVSGNPPFAFQWQFDGTNLTDAGNVSGSTSATLTLQGAGFTNTGSYRFIVTNAFGSATSSVATLTVVRITPLLSWAIPPGIGYGTALDSNQLNATVGIPGSFAYSPAAGNVPNAGTNLLSVVFTPADSTNYSNAAGSVNLVVSPAPLTLTANSTKRPFGQNNPVFTGSIKGVTNGDNLTASFSCLAAPASPPGPYAITPSLLDPDHRAGNYSVNIVNGVLTILPGSPPAIVGHSPAVGPTNGGTAVVLTGSGFELGATLNFGSIPATILTIQGPTSLTAVTPPEAAGAVDIILANPDGTHVTVAGGFVFGVPPSLQNSPASRTNTLGSTVQFTVVATGQSPLTYQWQLNGNILLDNGRITGSQTPTLRLSNSIPSDAGSYRVTVSNPYGTVNSQPALLSLIPNPTVALTVAQAGDEIVLSWPTNYPGFTLFSTTNLASPTTWQPVATATVVLDGSFTVSQPSTNAQTFYRLQQ